MRIINSLKVTSLFSLFIVALPKPSAAIVCPYMDWRATQDAKAKARSCETIAKHMEWLTGVVNKLAADQLDCQINLESMPAEDQLPDTEAKCQDLAFHGFPYEWKLLPNGSTNEWGCALTEANWQFPIGFQGTSRATAIAGSHYVFEFGCYNTGLILKEYGTMLREAKYRFNMFMLLGQCGAETEARASFLQEQAIIAQQLAEMLEPTEKSKSALNRDGLDLCMGPDARGSTQEATTK